MKEIFKSGLSLFGRLIIVNIMCFFMVISINVLVTAAFTQNIGYTAYGTSSDSSEQVELYTHYDKDGEDTKLKEYEDKGYTITKSNIRSQLSGTGYTVFHVVAQLFCIALLASFIYPNFWQMGTKDSNLVQFKHKKEDKLKGLKGGLVAIIPSLLVLAFITATKSGISAKFPVVLLKFLFSSYYSLIELTIGKVATLGELSVLQILPVFLMQLFVPLVAFIAYLLGYKNISLGEKLIYKKNKNK